MKKTEKIKWVVFDQYFYNLDNAEFLYVDDDRFDGLFYVKAKFNDKYIEISKGYKKEISARKELLRIVKCN